jgi:hypothetical protein
MPNRNDITNKINIFLRKLKSVQAQRVLPVGQELLKKINNVAPTKKTLKITRQNLNSVRKVLKY